MESQQGTSTVLLSAIILAGGRSSRMGEDKALLQVQGVPLLQHICEIAIALCDSVYIVTPWQERYQHFLSHKCQFIREVPLLGESLPQGPLVGFAQGLAEVKTDWVLLLACDLPQLRLEVLQAWAAQLDQVGEEAIALLTRNAKGWEPLCGFYRRSYLPELTQYINQGGRSFQQWLAQHPVQVVSLPDTQMLFNCNTPADYAAVKKRTTQVLKDI